MGIDCIVMRENTEGFYSDRNMYLGVGELMPTKDVAISNDGYLFITVTQGHRIQKFSTPLVENSLIIEEEQNLQTEITPESEKIEDRFGVSEKIKHNITMEDFHNFK